MLSSCSQPGWLEENENKLWENTGPALCNGSRADDDGDTCAAVQFPQTLPPVTLQVAGSVQLPKTVPKLAPQRRDVGWAQIR